MRAMVLSGSPCGLNCCEETPAQPALRTARPTAAVLKLFMLPPVLLSGGASACPADGSASRLHQIHRRAHGSYWHIAAKGIGASLSRCRRKRTWRLVF